jgi:hypothetical protein
MRDALIAVAVLGFVARAGAAQDGVAVSTSEVAPPPQGAVALAEAKEAFEAAAKAANAGDFATALVLMRKSYERSKHPWLLFNLGSLHEKLGDCRAALQSFEAYVAAVPNGKRLQEARASIAALRPTCPESAEPALASFADEGASPPPVTGDALRLTTVPRLAPAAVATKEPSAVREAQAASSAGEKAVGISALVGGAVAAGLAAYFAWSAEDHDDAFEAASTRADALPLEEKPAYSSVQSIEAARDADRTRAVLFGGVSAVLVGTGLWFLLRSRSDDAPSRESQAPHGFELHVGRGHTVTGSWSAAF